MSKKSEQSMQNPEDKPNSKEVTIDQSAIDEPATLKDPDTEIKSPKNEIKDKSAINKREKKQQRKQQIEENEPKSVESQEPVSVIAEERKNVPSAKIQKQTNKTIQTSKNNKQAVSKRELKKQQQEEALLAAQLAKAESKEKFNIMENLSKIDGACDYFYILEKENEEIQEEYQRKNKGKDSADTSSAVSREQHELPKGYPQKHMFKPPKVDPEKYQIEVNDYFFLGDREKYEANPELKDTLIVYQNQANDLPNNSNRANMIKRKVRRSNSEEHETIKFRDPYDQKNARKLQRRDAELAPVALNQEPAQLFIRQQDGLKYKTQELEEYLEFCGFVMRSAPVQGNYCGIWLRGSHMYKENAMKLLNSYSYNFDLAKFHILYPIVMADPIKKLQIMQVAKDHPNDFAKEVANAVIDLQGCKQEEIDEIVNKFRYDLDNRINEEQLKYHLTALERIKVPTPPDIEERIKRSLEFSKEIKKKCNIQIGSTKGAQHIPTDKKMKLEELYDLFEEQKTYSYITSEMIILQQYIEKAKQWKMKVESLRDIDIIQFKVIEQIYQDGKNLPVNFQELMTELKQRKNKAEDLNNRIQDILIIRKTRQRVGEVKQKSGKSKRGHQKQSDDAPGEEEMKVEEDDEPKDNQDKEKILRTLLEEANEMGLQSDQISKLQQKLNDIDKWKDEVIALFSNEDEEAQNFKRYRDHYKSLLARSSVFQIELELMRQLQRKCSFIDWRDKVEEIAERLEKQEKLTLDTLLSILDEGCEKGFVSKQKKSGYVAVEIALQDPINILLKNFKSFQTILEVTDKAQIFNKQLKRALQKMKAISQESSSSSENSQVLEILDEKMSIDDLLDLEVKGIDLNVDVEHFKSFKLHLDDVRKSQLKCEELMQSLINIETEEFKISSRDDLNVLLQARESFTAIKVESRAFQQFDSMVIPFIQWLNKAVRIVKQYVRALGLKQSSLNLNDSLLEPEGNPNPFDQGSNFETVVKLVQQLEEPKFQFLAECEEGKLLQQILQATLALTAEFSIQSKLKRAENFDQLAYFKLLEQVQNSGLPIQESIIEEARIEHKREKWIKKFHDLQSAGNAQAGGISNQDSQSTNNQQLIGSMNAPLASSHVNIKKVDVLVKDYQQSPELNLHPECQAYYQQLVQQQSTCQAWLDKFNECFNSQGNFEPKGGQVQIDQLLLEGENLGLKLKEYLDLQLHQKETSQWQQTTERILNGSKTVTLDQLKKHIKDTLDIADNQPDLVQLLESLRDSATMWKIFANTLLKVRPIENFNLIVEQQINVNISSEEDLLESQQDRSLFCICRQPENGAHMLCCDYCDMWYHYICVGLPKDIKLDKVKYKCVGCATREGKPALLHSKSQNQDQSLTDGNLLIDQDPEVNLHQIDIETILLDMFITKQRLSHAQFEYVLMEGIKQIPLKLEELPQLQFLNTQMNKWRAKAKNQINKGPQIKVLISSFIQINIEKVMEESEIARQLKEIQNQEKYRDDQLLSLIIQSQSFPVILPEENLVVSILRYRDLIRKCLQTHFVFNINSSSKQSKQNKLKLKKETKKLFQIGESILTCLNKEDELYVQTRQLLDIIKSLGTQKVSNSFDVFLKIDNNDNQTQMVVSIPIEDDFVEPSLQSQITANQPYLSSQPFQTLINPQLLTNVNKLSSQKQHDIRPVATSSQLFGHQINFSQTSNLSTQNRIIDLTNSINLVKKFENLNKLKEICNLIETHQEQIENFAQHNQNLTEWLQKTANYTIDILENGDEKIDDNVTLAFIEEGNQVLKEALHRKM